MNQEDFVIFAELDRDHFADITQVLSAHFADIESGSQGDDWIWIHLGEDKIEIDSFYSIELEVKGKYKYLTVAKQIIQNMNSEWILQSFDPPKIDMTR